MSKKVFISYRHQQAEWVRTTLYPVLAAGGAEVVIDHRKFAAGAVVRRQMRAAQDMADLHLLVLTPDYLQSDHCAERIRCDLPPEIQRHQPLYVDPTGNRQQDAQAWKLLMEGCAAYLGTSVPN